MAAPNAQPFGSRGGMKAPNEHAPQEAGKPAGSRSPGSPGGNTVAPHGTPKPVGNGKTNPLK
jgi:hypothetical protein